MEIYVVNTDGTGETRVTNNKASDTTPSWNGSRIVFTSNRDGNSEVYSMNSDGSDTTRLTNSSSADTAPDA